MLLKLFQKVLTLCVAIIFGAMIITHYQRLLNYITPDVVHIMMDGRVVLSGDAELAARLKKEGYAKNCRKKLD